MYHPRVKGKTDSYAIVWVKRNMGMDVAIEVDRLDSTRQKTERKGEKHNMANHSDQNRWLLCCGIELGIHASYVNLKKIRKDFTVAKRGDESTQTDKKE